MADESPRTRSARDAAERALIRVVHHYGSRPEFVLLGGLVPDLLCSSPAAPVWRWTASDGFVSGETHTRRRAAWASASGEHLLDRGLFTELDPQAQRLGDRHHRGEGRVGRR